MPRPYGPIGLIVSLVVIVILAVVYFFAMIGLAAMADALIQGPAHVAAIAHAARAAVKSGDLLPYMLPIFAAGIPIYFALIGGVATLAVWRGGRCWRELIAWTPWSPRRAGRPFWGLLAGGIVYGVAASVALSLASPQTGQWSRLPSGALGAAMAYVLIAVAAPVAEEILFRGWIFTSLRARLSFWPTNALSAAVFAIAHWEHTHLYALAVFPLGLMLGLVREETGSTRASATFHAIYNCVALTLTFIGPS